MSLDGLHVSVVGLMKWSYLFLAFLAMLVLGLADNIRGPVFPDLLREFSLSDSRGSLFFMCASASGLVINIASVWWLRRYGPLSGIKIFQSFMSLGLFTISFSSSLIALYLGAVFVGLSFGGTGITQNILISWGATPKLRRKFYATLHSIYGLASLLAPLVLIVVYRLGFGWQKAFFLIGLLSLAVNIWSFFVKAQPDDPPYPAVQFRHTHTPLRTVCWFSAMISFYVVAELLIGTRLVLLARREWGIEASQANQLLSLFYFLLLSGRLVMSFWHFKAKTKNLLISSILISLCFFSVGVFTHPLIIALCGLPMSIFFPCALAFAYEEQALGADNIIAWTLAWNAGAILIMHWLIGWISDVASLKIAILVGPASLLLCLTLLLTQKYFALSPASRP